MRPQSSTETALRRRLLPVWKAAGFALLYYAACAFAALLMNPASAVVLFWPAAGVGLAGVVRLGWRHAWFVAVAMLAYHASLEPVSFDFLIYSVLGNTLATLAGGWLATSRPLPARLSLRGMVRILQGGVLLATISTLIGIAGLRHASLLPSSDLWTGTLRWFLGDLLGVIAVAPALLLLSRAGAANANPYKDYGSEPERLIWLVALVASFLLTAWAANAGGQYALGVTALPLAILAWSAVRFPPWWTARATLCSCLLIGSFAGFGLAGFSMPVDALDTFRLLGFLCVLAALPLVLALATHERRVATRLQLHSATIDPITGLHNRTAFEQHVRARLTLPDAPPRALAYLDIDHLKLVNDTDSHAAGDALIRGVAEVLRNAVRPGDAIGHFGGDEFGVLLHNCLPAAAEERARELLRNIENRRYSWNDRNLGTTASIGLVPFQGQQDFGRLLSQADAACFAAKELGGNQVCRAALDGGERLDHTHAMRWAIRVREAVENNGLLLYSQAIAPLQAEHGNRHFEFLLRIREPGSGEVLLPERFFPAADRYHLGVRIDRAVVELALSWLERHADPADIDLCCINLSADALIDEEFIGFLNERLRRSSFPADKLCLEITETSAMRDVARAQRFIAQMRSRGCRFALDDFGTGFCSFAYLRSLNVDYFKIDGSFVREMHDSPLSLQIVRAITDIAHALGKHSIAEQAETPEQLALLTEMGVDMAQGFVVHRPEPVEAYFARTRSLQVAEPAGPQTVA